MENASPTLDTRRIRHAEVAYEDRDLNPQAVFYFLLVLGIVIVLAYLVLWGVFKQLGASQYAGHASSNPIMTSDEQLKEIGGDPANSFPMPHLQPDPIADLNKFRIREEQWMNTYGWVDQADGKIHLPIETAIEIMAASWPAQQQESTGKSQAASSNNGKIPPEAIQTFTDERGGNYGW